MHIAFGVTWNDSKRSKTVRAFAAALLAVTIVAAGQPAALSAGLRQMVSVIVRALPGSERAATDAVTRTGGTLVRPLGLIHGFSAEIPAPAIATIGRAPGVLSITRNGSVRLMAAIDGYDATTDVTSMYNVTKLTGARAYWNAGYTGKGIDIAMIDSGVVPVEGLSATGKVLNGPDLSFESQTTNLQYLDTYGHGTHMAGIIAGRDSTAISGQYANDQNSFLGMAPDARVVSVKVASARGETDVSQVIAAIDWVVQHRADPGMNIRVLNLSFGTDSTQSYLVDPLAYAAEQAWLKGIVVVSATGNRGAMKHVGLTDPAYAPNVLAVGSADVNGTLSMVDDSVSDFSGNGGGRASRNPDLIAPGAHIQSLAVAGSSIDQTYGDTGRINSRYFRGSGTSQAAAVASGAVALLLQQRPTMNPEQVRKLLMSSAHRLGRFSAADQGAGEMDLSAALGTATPLIGLSATTSTGIGSLEGSRGSAHVSYGGVDLTGEQDIFGASFNSATEAALEAAGTSWTGGVWNGNSWSGNSWSGNSWSGITWSGNSWSGITWSGITWSGNSWSGITWSGNSWSGNSWSGISWSGNSWSGNSWSGNSWSSAAWS